MILDNTGEEAHIAKDPNIPAEGVHMPTRGPRTRQTASLTPPTAEILNVRMTAALLTVSPDTVYDPFKAGELPGRQVTRK